MNNKNKFFAVSFCLVLTACVSSGRYSQKHDSAPIRPPTNTELMNATVSHEPLSRANRPYEVFGKRYVPMTERLPYSEKGTASWYGKKFHGHLTSNGETYDMYAMSAAHKTLPLPSYVKVTNLANNKSVVVRVNDRGPFHNNRIIDLSYSAAYKIGVYDTGTAKVKVEAILPNQSFNVLVSGFENAEQALESKRGLAIMLNQSVASRYVDSQKQLVFGPFNTKTDAHEMATKIKQFGFEQIEIENGE